MKVWVLFVSSEDESILHGLFSTEALASRAADDYLDANPDNSCRYWEVEVDAISAKDAWPD